MFDKCNNFKKNVSFVKIIALFTRLFPFNINNSPLSYKLISFIFVVKFKEDNMSLQYISDSQGETAGIFIPIDQWKLLKEKYEGIEDMVNSIDTKSYQTEVLESIKQAVEEMKLINEGKLQATPAKDFLDEL